MFNIRRFVGTGFAIAVVAGSLPLAACGGGGDGDSDDDTAALGGIKIDSSRNDETTAERTEQIIEVKDNEFSPAEVTVKTGTKIIWKWVDTTAPHSIQLTGNTSPEQTSGTYERVMDQTGSSFAYQCGVHKAAMTGRIIVE